MKVLMTGGGTGGHVNPAIAIADCIAENEPGSEIAFVGTARGIENKLLAGSPYPLYHVEIRGLKRSLSLSNLKTAYYVLRAPGKAKRLLRDFQPELVVGTGGYVCWPVLKAAQDMGIPTALHESNAVPGVAVRMLEKRADRIFLNFEEAAEYLKYPQKAMHTGNPLRGGFSAIDRAQARRKLDPAGKYALRILSFGGSMGAERVNDMVLTLMRDYVAGNKKIYHLHACGAIERDLCSAQYADMGLSRCENTALEEYIYDMPEQMAAADLVICRAGAMTLSELAMQNKACLLIPSPNVTGNHQLKNAQALERAGAAAVFEEKDFAADPDRFVRTAAELLTDGGRRQAMEKAIGNFCVPDAKKRIYKELRRLADQSTASRAQKKK